MSNYYCLNCLYSKYENYLCESIKCIPILTTGLRTVNASWKVFQMAVIERKTNVQPKRRTWKKKLAIENPIKLFSFLRNYGFPLQIALPNSVELYCWYDSSKYKWTTALRHITAQALSNKSQWHVGINKHVLELTLSNKSVVYLFTVLVTLLPISNNKLYPYVLASKA